MKGIIKPARAGDLDPLFGVEGKATLTMSRGTLCLLNGTVLGSSAAAIDIRQRQITMGVNDRILCAFSLPTPEGPRAAMGRLASDGKVDPHSPDIGFAAWNDPVTRALGTQVVERKGMSTLLCMTVNDNTPQAGTAIAAIHGDGTPDLSFGTKGIVSFIKGDKYPRFLGMDIVSADESHILLSAGTLDDSGLGAALIRLTPDGALDTSFHGSGIRWLADDFQGTAMGPRLLAVRQDEYIVVCAHQGTRARRYRFDNGESDLSFGDQGAAELARPGGTSTYIFGMSIDSDGQLWFAGRWGDDSDDVTIYQHGLLVATDRDGRLNPAFGDNGFKILKKDKGNLELNFVTRANDGRILFGGRRMSGIGEPSWWGVVGRTSSSGELDPDFGNGGFADFLDLSDFLTDLPEFAYSTTTGRVFSYNYGPLRNEATIRAFLT